MCLGGFNAPLHHILTRKRRQDEEVFLADASAVELLADPPKKRQRHACRGRMDWDRHLRDLRPSEFRRTYRMTLKTFDFILERIRGSLVGPNEVLSRQRADSGGYTYIEPELKLSMTLRFLAGRSSRLARNR